MTTSDILALAGVTVALYRYRRYLVKTTTDKVRRETRRNLIEHLRQNSRGLVLLDFAVVSNAHIDGPLTVLGDDTLITANYFHPEGETHGDQ